MKFSFKVGIGMALLAMGLIFTSMSRATAPVDDDKDIVDVAVGAGKFKTLVKAVQTAELVETLKGKGPFTVFAPTDEAFAKLPEGILEKLLNEEGHKTLKAILLYHVVPGKVMAKDVVELTEAKTVNGKKIKIKVEDGKVKINNANVLKTDIETSNGIIHIIDSVILPPPRKKGGDE